MNKSHITKDLKRSIDETFFSILSPEQVRNWLHAYHYVSTTTWRFTTSFPTKNMELKEIASKASRYGNLQIELSGHPAGDEWHIFEITYNGLKLTEDTSLYCPSADEKNWGEIKEVLEVLVKGMIKAAIPIEEYS